MKLTSRSLRRSSVIELSMTSMIDVVFLLLIFFMTTSSFVKTERDLDPNVQMKERSASEVASDLEPAIVEVVQANGVEVYRLGGRDMTTAGELERVLRQLPNKVDGAFVKVNDNVSFGMAASAIQACKSAGFAPVSYVPID